MSEFTKTERSVQMYGLGADCDEFGHSLPAILWESNDTKIYEWHQNSLLHRIENDDNGLTLPARIWSNGELEWWKNGKRHRDDRDENGRILPAITSSNGTQFWYNNGHKHRDDKDEDGNLLPAVIHFGCPNSNEYCINGVYQHVDHAHERDSVTEDEDEDEKEDEDGENY